ncbi:MAG: (d)CMP kinase [Fimbriimonadaceae bacterium]|nr:(d)CMP kinase [Alphaproteobacteria bacterium]
MAGVKVIAIDGPAASGKGTLARRLAKKYNLRYLDTGLLYRAVAHALISNNQDLHNEKLAVRAAKSIDVATLDSQTLRTRGVGEAASIVAGIPAVRTAILNLQREFAKTPPGAVLDGRDIGTVICPDADVKLFVTASREARASRRTLEMRNAGLDVEFEEILSDITIRDDRDTRRAVAPLKAAEDAHLLDTTNLDIEAAFQAAVAIVSGSCA